MNSWETSVFTIDDVRRILRQCAGENGVGVLDGDILDSTFSSLGYDSLALLETLSVIEREFGVELPDDLFASVKTPRSLIGVVQERLARADRMV
ncbi:acyl carrier protein [Streptomyces sp. NPDC059176]|uniref:acyl carrier protein n=1 Tax=unclassified Streptomyces TaxID=2593676 RepID=UPI0036CE5B6C